MTYSSSQGEDLVPGFGKRKQNRDPEDAARPLADPALPAAPPNAIQRSQPLTLELLDWLIHALEAVITTPQLQDMADRRVSTSLRDALRHADALYPYTIEQREKLYARFPDAKLPDRPDSERAVDDPRLDMPVPRASRRPGHRMGP